MVIYQILNIILNIIGLIGVIYFMIWLWVNMIFYNLYKLLIIFHSERKKFYLKLKSLFKYK